MTFVQVLFSHIASSTVGYSESRTLPSTLKRAVEPRHHRLKSLNVRLNIAETIAGYSSQDIINPGRKQEKNAEDWIPMARRLVLFVEAADVTVDLSCDVKELFDARGIAVVFVGFDEGFEG